MAKRDGFTLVELLVVIAIIGVLAAISVPVFTKVKEAGKRTSCLSNVRQLTLGVTMYCNDSDDVLPPTAYPTNSPIWIDLVEPYINNATVRVCPDDQADSASYGLNAMLFTDLFEPNLPPQPTMTNMEQIARPAETLMVSEMGAADDLVTPLPGTLKVIVPDDTIGDPTEARPIFRHFSRDNISFFDGHAKSWRKEDFYVGWKPLDYWFCMDRTDAQTCLTPPGT